MLSFVQINGDLDSWVAKHRGYVFVALEEIDGKYVALVGDERDHDLVEEDKRPAPAIIGRNFGQALDAIEACEEFAKKLHFMPKKEAANAN